MLSCEPRNKGAYDTYAYTSAPDLVYQPLLLPLQVIFLPEGFLSTVKKSGASVFGLAFCQGWETKVDASADLYLNILRIHRLQDTT